MLSDHAIQQAMTDGQLALEPYDPGQLQPASYDLRVGKAAFSSSSKAIISVDQRGLVVIEPGEFAVVETRERVVCGAEVAAQLGLRSEYARKGLLMLSGPQVDPGFSGVLVVRLVNLAPNAIALQYEAPFLTAQFFRFAEPVANAYSGPHQAQTGISALDINELAGTEGLTLGQMVKTLTVLAADVSELKGSVKRLSWSIPFIVALGMTIIGIIVGVK